MFKSREQEQHMTLTQHAAACSVYAVTVYSLNINWHMRAHYMHVFALMMTEKLHYSCGMISGHK